jgi:hypothetical protein
MSVESKMKEGLPSISARPFCGGKVVGGFHIHLGGLKIQ